MLASLFFSWLITTAQVSDEHGLDFASKAADASRAPVQVDAARAEADLEDTLEARLAALRG